MRHNQIAFSLLLICYEDQRLWHHHEPELDFKDTNFQYLTNKVLNLLLGQLIVSFREIFRKIFINSRPLFINFNNLFGCLKINFESLHWQGVCLAYLILIVAPFLVWSTSHQEPCNKIGSQSPVEHSNRAQTRVEIEVLTHSTSFNCGK